MKSPSLSRTAPSTNSPLVSALLICCALAFTDEASAAANGTAAAAASPPSEQLPAQLGKLTVTTAQGMYQGVIEAGVSRFLGIPYALPPVGERRWQPPKPMRSHDGIVPATAVGTACLQTSRELPSNEDCLRLNIWSPGVDNRKRPVMVWIHGGGFRSGSNDIQGEVFASPTDHPNPAVVVAINYRLGPLGFFSHKAIAGKHANFGVLDMIAALQWVQDNISTFGGDPDNVTIFGVSAGGMAVNVLMTSPLSEGLFHKAIAQSGYGTWPLSRTRHAKGPAVLDMDGSVVPAAESLTSAVVSRAMAAQRSDQRAGERSEERRSRQTREALYALPGRAIVEGLDGFQLPYVDGQSIKAEPGIRFATNKQHKVPFITGGNSNEGTVMPGSGVTIKDFADSFGSDTQSIRTLYERDFSGDDRLGWQRVFGDNRYLLAASVLGEQMATQQPNTWLYYVDFVPESFRKNWLGTPHGADAWLLLNGHTTKDPAVLKFTREMRSYWLNFAATGNPNGRGLARWPAYSSTDRWLVMGGESAAQTGVIGAKLALLKNRWRRRVSSALR